MAKELQQLSMNSSGEIFNNSDLVLSIKIMIMSFQIKEQSKIMVNME